MYPVASSMYNLCYSKASNNEDLRSVLYDMCTSCCNLCNVKNEGNIIDCSFSLSHTYLEFFTPARNIFNSKCTIYTQLASLFFVFFTLLIFFQ